MVARGIDWNFNFVDNFGVGERVRPGVRTSYAANTITMDYCYPRDRYQDAARQAWAADGWWTWFGNMQAIWLMRREVFGNGNDPVGTPHWQGAMQAWRHAKTFQSNVLFMDAHVGPVTPHRPHDINELRTKTVDTARVFTWLPGEYSQRYDNSQYGPFGEVEAWRPRYPDCKDWLVNPGKPKELDLNYRSANRLWNELSNNPLDRR